MQFNSVVVKLGGMKLFLEYKPSFERWYQEMRNISGRTVEAEEVFLNGFKTYKFVHPMDKKYSCYCYEEDVEFVLVI